MSPFSVQKSLDVVIDLIGMIRPGHWVKNLLVFAPLFFGRRMLESEALLPVLLAFLGFCLAASASYIINDVFDRESDRKHPVKKLRPLARDAITIRTGIILSALFAAAGIGFVIPLREPAVAWLCGYLLLTFFYSWKLKHVPILDITIVSLGFLIRLGIGASAAGISLSGWIIVLTFTLSLFLALDKRRDDVLILNATNNRVRKSVDGYNLEFVSHSMSIMASVTIVAYILYSVSPEVQLKLGTEHLYLTGVFVVLGILRYLQRAFVENRTGSPVDVVLSDRLIQLTLIGWMISLWFMVYL